LKGEYHEERIERAVLQVLANLGEATEKELERLEELNKLLVPEVFYESAEWRRRGSCRRYEQRTR